MSLVVLWENSVIGIKYIVTAYFQVSGLSSPIYKEYHRTLIQERDRDLTGDHGYVDGHNLFSCLSRFVSTFLCYQKMTSSASWGFCLRRHTQAYCLYFTSQELLAARVDPIIHSDPVCVGSDLDLLCHCGDCCGSICAC